MGKHDASPTVGWSISSRVNKWVAFVFFILLVLLVAETLWIASAVKKDCKNPYKIRKEIGSAWLVIYAGSSKNGCGDPY